MMRSGSEDDKQFRSCGGSGVGHKTYLRTSLDIWLKEVH